MIVTDILIIGAGPAGAAAALTCAPQRATVIVDRCSEVSARIGESLVPAARRLFAEMDLLASFEAQGHSPAYANRFVWGSDEPGEMDFLQDPDGHGWHLDRAKFETWLREQAQARGAGLFAPTKVRSVVKQSGRWHVEMETDRGTVSIAADFLIDAAGRGAPIARRLGAKPRVEDRLMCAFMRGSTGESCRGSGLTYVEAAREGWWYTAPLPGGSRILAFHTDADLPALRRARNGDVLQREAMRRPELGKLLDECRFTPTTEVGLTAASSASIDECVGEYWVAAGDAALAFDPISAQGLFNALYTGRAAAEAALQYLSGDREALARYRRQLQDIRAAYRINLAHWYSAETRWIEAPFWSRRSRRRASAVSR